MILKSVRKCTCDELFCFLENTWEERTREKKPQKTPMFFAHCWITRKFLNFFAHKSVYPALSLAALT